MSEPYKFLGLKEPKPVKEVLNHAKATGDASRDDAEDRKAKFAAITGAALLATGVVAALDYGLGHDPVAKKFKAQDANTVDAGAQPERLPENPSDLKIEVPAEK
jgi:hypothetical protein